MNLWNAAILTFQPMMIMLNVVGHVHIVAFPHTLGPHTQRERRIEQHGEKWGRLRGPFGGARQGRLFFTPVLCGFAFFACIFLIFLFVCRIRGGEMNPTLLLPFQPIDIHGGNIGELRKKVFYQG